MNKKRIFALIMSAVMLSATMVGCSGKKEQFVENPTTETTKVTVAETLEAVEIKREIVRFSDKDKEGNTLTLTPIFDNDGDTLFAGYVVSAVDKNGKPLDAKAYNFIGEVVKAKRRGDTGMLDKAVGGALIKIVTYADEQGNLLAIQDAFDLDGDGDSTELLRLRKTVDGNGITKTIVDYTTVTLKKEGDKLYIVDGNKKIPVKQVDSTNTDVQKKEDETAKKNENAKKKAEKTTSTTKADNSDKNNGKDPDNGSRPVDNKPSDTTAPQSDDINIVLKRNSKAECSSSKVEISDALVTIKDEGDYVITSETDLWHGRIAIKLPNDKKCEVKFRNVDISYNKGNVLQIIDTSIDSDRTFLEREAGSSDEAFDNELQNVSESDSAPNVDLSFPEGTHSTFTSSANSYTGVVYNESKLTIRGNGKWDVESKVNADNCICSTKSITIKNCSVSLATAQNNNPSKLAAGTGSAKGIFSYNKVKVESGSLNIKTNGDAIRCSRFMFEGGTADICSSACDAIDTDNEITISGGKITAVATEKSAYKVRRVNSGKEREGKNDTFDINGGTVIGESKKSSAINAKSKQFALSCYIGSTNGQKTYGSRAIIDIMSGGSKVASTSNKCTTFIYSTASLSPSKTYTMSALSKTADFKIRANVNVGTASITG